MNDPDTRDNSMTVEEAISDQFYSWEIRGRGWVMWDDAVVLEPPFEPFFWKPVSSPGTDDGRQQTVLSSARDWIRGLFSRKEIASTVAETESEFDPDSIVAKAPLAWTELRINVPQSLVVSKEAAEQLLLSLSLCRGQLSFELVGLGDSIVLQIACIDEDVEQVRQQINAFFPECSITETSDFLSKQWSALEQSESAVVEFGLSREFVLPLAQMRDFKHDPLVGIVGAMADVEDGEIAVLQVMFTPVRHAWAESMLRSVVFPDGTEVFMSSRDYLGAAKEKISRPLYSTVIRASCRSDQDDRAWKTIRRMTGALSALGDPNGNELIPLDNDDYDSIDHSDDVPLRTCRRSGMILNSDELVSLVHLPSAVVRSEKFRGAPETSKAAPSIVARGSLRLGENGHNGQTRSVGLSRDQRTRHMHVLGASGTGKSTFLLNLILQDIEHGQGIGVLDPHGDLIDAILDRMPENRTNDVIFVDPSDEAFPVGFNILAAHSETEKKMLASDLVAIFRRLSTSWGDQMNSILANGVLAILEHDRGGTLADLRRLLVERSFREEFIKGVRDEQVVYYWKKEFPFLTGRPQGPVLTRLDSFLRPKAIRYMVCQQANRIDFADIMDKRKIFLARLSHGAFGEENAQLLGSLFVSKFHQIAMGRQQQNETDRQNFWLYVDEFQHFATPSMASLLSGVRKYKLGLVLAHQELHQLESRSPEVASAVLANAYTRVCFRLGDSDARKLETGFSGFDAGDLQKLGTGKAICRVERGDFDFNIRTSPVDDVDRRVAQERRKKVAEQSRAKYAVAREVVEEQLRKSVEETADDEPPTRTKTPKSASSITMPPATMNEARTQPSTPVSGVPIPADPPPVVVKPRKTPDPENATPGRGGPQHKYLQQLIKQWGDGMGFRSTVEKSILGGEGSIDVALEKSGRCIACLISVTTGEEWELASVRKCLKANCEPVMLICPDQKHLKKLESHIASSLNDSERLKVSFVPPERLFTYIEQIEIRSLHSEKTVRGYKVKTSFVPLDATNSDLRQQAISKVVAKALKRNADSKRKKKEQ